MKKIIIPLILLIIFFQTNLFSNPIDKFINVEIPDCSNSYHDENRSHEILFRENYTLCYSEEHEQSEWVAYELTKSELEKNASRKNRFISDPEISTQSAHTSDYTNSNFDRGHLAPAADMAFSVEAMSDSFYMSNISPQSPSLNRIVWKEIEEIARSWAEKYESVYITTGPILDKTDFAKIGENQVSVPEYFYKILVSWDNDNNQILCECYLVPNFEPSNNPSDYLTTLSHLEEITNIDFYPLLNDLLQ